MVLFLTDNAKVGRRLRHDIRSETNVNSNDGSRPSSVLSSARSSAEVIVLPDRLLSASAVTGHAIAQMTPEIVAVLTTYLDEDSGENDNPDPIGLIYRCQVAGETWMPDIVAKHELTALSVVDSSPIPDGCRLISPSAAAAVAAAITILSPIRTIGVVSHIDRSADAVAAAFRLVTTTSQQVINQNTRRSGGMHVEESVERAGKAAEELRLTTTQRTRFVATARAAAIRSGIVPAPLRDHGDGGTTQQPRTRHVTKQWAKERLKELEVALTEWHRAAI